MCGIAGAIGWIGQTQLQAVEHMNAAQTHRGPDDVGRWSSRDPLAAPGPGLVLGHRRLSILDLSASGHQPMQHAPTGCLLTYNGEIYNFRELRSELEAEGVRFESRTDTEVLLAAYLRWGRGCLQRLRGMFAFALWDPRDGQLLLARDRLGIKPLYYVRVQHDAGVTVYFASELRALLATGEVARHIDPVGLASYLWNGVVQSPRTIVRGCRLLPAGTSMVIGAEAPAGEAIPYWQLPAHEPMAEAEASARLHEALESAVRLRLVSDVPLAVFLSGGIDSSAVAALAASASPSPVTTFNIGFDEQRYDESPHARAIAARLGTDHREVRLTEQTFRSQLHEALQSLDQPTFDAINTYLVSRAVREAGISVALAGTGGDELFGGYPSFRDLPRARWVSRRLHAIPEPWLAGAGAAVGRLLTGPPGEVPPQTRWGKLGDALTTGGDLLDLYQVSYGLFTRAFLRQLAVDEAGTSHGVPVARAHALRLLIGDQPDLHAISQLETTFFLGERLLRDTDCASMAVSLEVRLPLIDHQVIECLARVPEASRFQPLGRKHLLRRLAMPHLDPSLFDRPKAGFELPLDVWCRRELRGELDGLLRDPRAAQRVGLDGAAIARLWRAYQDGAPGLYWSRIWALFTLLWWCSAHDLQFDA